MVRVIDYVLHSVCVLLKEAVLAFLVVVVFSYSTCHYLKLFFLSSLYLSPPVGSGIREGLVCFFACVFTWPGIGSDNIVRSQQSLVMNK